MDRGTSLLFTGLGAFMALFGALALLGGVYYLGLFMMAIGASLVAVGVRRRPGAEPPAQAARAPPRVDPVPELDEATLGDIPEPVTVCSRCGYLGVRPGQMRDGVYAGGGQLLSNVVCDRCGHVGLGTAFDRREEYGAFLRELHRRQAAPQAP